MSVVASAILCRIHAVSVSYSSDYFYNHIDNTLQQMGLLKDNGNPLRATDILEVVDGYKGRGYGLSTAEELSECSSMCPTHLACNGVMYVHNAWIRLSPSVTSDGCHPSWRLTTS